MLEKLKGVEARFVEVEKKMGDPEVLKDMDFYQKLGRQHAEMASIVAAYRELQNVLAGIKDANEMLNDPEMKDLARQELDDLLKRQEKLDVELKKMLMPKDPNDDRNVIIEIRAGTGGDEAGLFASDLFRMYSRYAELKNWKVEIMDYNASGIGAVKEVIALVKGDRAYSRLKYESGIHRVQRVPTTETQGRIHTSAVTVAVLPEADEVDVEIPPETIKVDVFRSSGPGGQSVNTTDSAVRITHLPTGLVVTCQDEKSQHKNRAKAMKVLQSRLLDMKIQEQNQKISEERKSQVGTGDRSGRIRTYNFPQGRMTDHRIGLTLYRLENIMEGDIDEIIEELHAFYQAEALKEAGSGHDSSMDHS